MKDFDVSGLIRLVVGVLTPAAVFYVIGYVVTQAYVIATRLQASFWFTERFYREAGARFLLDVLLAVALLPHLFIALSALFILCFPAAARDAPPHRLPGLSGSLVVARAVPLKHATFAATLLFSLGCLIFILHDCGVGDAVCGVTLQTPDWLFSNRWVFGNAEVIWSEQYPYLRPMALFLALSIPTVVALGLLSYRLVSARDGAEAGDAANARKDEGGGPPSKSRLLIAFLAVSSFVVLVAYIPIAYGTYFYDFVVVSLVDNSKCTADMTPSAAKTSGKRKAVAEGRYEPIQCYLLGRFDTRYILIGRELWSDPSSKDPHPQHTGQRIYIKQIDKLEPFSIDSTLGTPLRSLMMIQDASY